MNRTKNNLVFLSACTIFVAEFSNVYRPMGNIKIIRGVFDTQLELQHAGVRAGFPSPASEDKGSIVLEMDGTTPVRKIVNLDVDAQVNLARGVIVTTTKAPVTNMPDFFGPASFHENDYSFFYKNLQENVAKRIETYKNNAE